MHFFVFNTKYATKCNRGTKIKYRNQITQGYILKQFFKMSSNKVLLSRIHSQLRRFVVVIVVVVIVIYIVVTIESNYIKNLTK